MSDAPVTPIPDVVPTPPPKQNSTNLVVGVVAAIALIAIAFLFIARNDGDGEAAAAFRVHLEGRDDVGADPFGDGDLNDFLDPGAVPVAAATTLPPAIDITPVSSEEPAVETGEPETVEPKAVGGGTPGLYGGSNDRAVCNAEAIASFLADNADKGKAWADAQGITVDQIPDFLGSLTPVVLQADTRVTNHGFRDGRATPLQSILQAGTAVLVDPFGLPRVKCNCGNPLLPPRIDPAAESNYEGEPWDGFDADTVVVVVRAPAQLAGIDVIDLDDGELVTVAVRSPAASTTTTTTTTTTTSTTTTTTTEPPTPVDITGEGTVTASSTFDGFSIASSVDGDPTTSWFSQGDADGPSSTYQWSGPTEVIAEITIVGNAENATPSFRTGFGFDSVTVQVLDAGSVVFEETAPLTGTPDPTVTVRPEVRGDEVRLVLTGHEDPSCGGFSELRIVAAR